MKHVILVLAGSLAASTALAAPRDLLQGYAAVAKAENPQFTEFSPSRGEQFYRGKRAHSGGRTVACASCHTDNPKAAGRHDRTGKVILPLAPAANRERFSERAKVEKWFKRNCQDVLERPCTAREQGDFLAYMLSIK